jgi:putative ABC transport system permease protein
LTAPLSRTPGWLARATVRADLPRQVAVAAPVVLLIALNATMLQTSLLLEHLQGGPVEGGQTWSLGLIVGISAGYASVAVVNTVALATAARRDELGALRTLGATRHQVLAVLRAEARLVTTVGILAGAAIAAASVGAFQLANDLPLQPVVSPVPYLGLLAGAVLLVAMAAETTGRLVTPRRDALPPLPPR